MNSINFYEKVNEYVKDLNKEEILNFLSNILRKIPESKYQEILCMFRKDKKIDNIKQKIEEYIAKFELMDELELYFYATGYESYGEYYDPWGGDWTWEYSDEDNVGKLIEEASFYAISLVNNQEYNYAKQLLDCIIYTNYQFYDEDGGEFFEISLKELAENHLISINVSLLCNYAIYATYQSTIKNMRAKKIYEYFTNENFRDVELTVSFKLGTEILKDLDDFIHSWILELTSKKIGIVYRLLKDIFEYTNYKNYKIYLKDLAKNQNAIFMDILHFLEKNHQTEEIISTGNLMLSYLDEKENIRNDISLFLANYDTKNKEKYLLNSFSSKTNVANLLRIMQNGYFEKNKEKINNIINEKYSANKSNMYYYLQFFLGNLDEFYEECKKHKEILGWSNSFIKTAVDLWLLLMTDKINTKVFSSILKSAFLNLEIAEHLEFLDKDYAKVFENWKNSIKTISQEKYITWIDQMIEKRVDGIINGNYRKSYYKVAILVVALDEMLTSQKQISEGECISFYQKKYSRRSAFKQEIFKYME